MSNGVQIIRGRMEMAGLVGPVWIAGWLYTLGFLHLQMPKALYALFIWPYYMGQFRAH